MPLALARCLASVAAWTSPASDSQVGAVAMARRDSPLVRRVQRILNAPGLAPRHPSSIWLLAAVIAVGVAAPMISADLSSQTPATPDVTKARTDAPQAQSPLQVWRPPNAGESLQQRWDWALAEANRRGLRDFWIAYSFDTPAHAEHVMMSDSVDGSFVTKSGHLTWQGPPLTDVLGNTSPTDSVGTVVVTLRYSSARENAILRGGYRSARLGLDFERRPVLWLGYATEADSFRRLEQLTSQVRDEKLRILFIEAASLHPTTDVVLPFLVRLLDPSNPVAIRREAAEGFDHHHDPRSVEILLRTARQDPSEEVRAEAAETIGEVQTPESIPALKELALGSSDGAVRREAAEAFSDQPPDRALPALETVIASSTHEDALTEAVEALGDIGGTRAAEILLDVVWKHPNERARREAVETLASIEGDASRAALVRIVWEHPDVSMQLEGVESLGDKAGSAAQTELERIVRDHPNEDVQAEAIETISDVSEQRLNATIVQTARSGRNARVRREAIDALSHVATQTSDAALLDQIEQVLEAAIFEDPDHSVRGEAIDALEELPTERAKRVLPKVIDRHPDAQMREEAVEREREWSH
jgi:HEAT repeat protein